MKRSEFKGIADGIYFNLQQHTYGYWITQNYPLVYEQKFGDLTIQVEISLLELLETHIHISVTLFTDCYAGIRLPMDPSIPITKTFIVVNNTDQH